MRTAFVVRTAVRGAAGTHGPFLRRVAACAGAPRGTLTVLFCDDGEIAELNRRWRGKRGPTDVLSFPGGGAPAGASEPHIGDLAISVETAARAARRAGHPLRREIETLLTHGLLHLLGYDHEADDGTMLRVQSRLLDQARRRPRARTAAKRAR